MDKVRSLYLEMLRILAALYVFIYHVGSETIDDKNLLFATSEFSKRLRLYNYSAHNFVIIFFVLSGYLITMSANRPGVTCKSFLIARLGRLYSVLLPALLFTYFVVFVFVWLTHIPLSNVPNTNNLFVRFFLNVAFLTQSWTLCSTPPLNMPIWSVNYELFYYLMIASLLLIKRNRLIVFILILLLAGLKIIILFPAWLAGSLLYYMSRRISLNKYVSLLLFCISLIAIIIILINPVYLPFAKVESNNVLWGQTLFFPWNYLSDYFFSSLVALHVFSLFSISQDVLKRLAVKPLNKLYILVQKVGNCTYTLYLFHVPLLFFYYSILPYDKTNSLHQIGLIILVVVSVYLIAKQTEWKVEFWRSLVAMTIKLVQSLLESKMLKFLRA